MSRSPMILLVLCNPAWADTLRVAPGVGYATIGEALADARDGDVIAVSAGVYEESVVVGVDVAIVGVGSGSTVLRGAGPLLRFEEVAGSLEGFALVPTGGRAVEIVAAQVEVDDLLVSDVETDVDGGALWIQEGSTVEVAHSTFARIDVGSAVGAAIAMDGSSLAVADCDFEGLSSDQGAGIWATGSDVWVERSGFSDGDANKGGGAIYADDSSLHLVDIEASGNYARYGGSAVKLSGSVATDERGVYVGNTSDRGVGAWHTSGGDITLVGTRIADSVGRGLGAAGLQVTGDAFDSAVLVGVVFEDNRGDGGSTVGGVWAMGGVGLSITDSLFSGDYSGIMATEIDNLSVVGTTFRIGSSFAIAAGGAPMTATFRANQFLEGGAGTPVDLTGVYDLEAEENLFCRNEGSVAGALAVRTEDGRHGDASRVDIHNNTFVGNRASEVGALLLAGQEDTRASVTNNLFQSNTAEQWASAAFDNGGTSTWINNLFVGNGPIPALNSYVPFDGLSDYNLFWDNDAYGPHMAGATGAHDIFADPWLYPLGDVACENLVFTVSCTGPAIDAGSPDLLDPDGSRSDIGVWGGPHANPAAFADADGDGVRGSCDCDDVDPERHPGAAEVWYDGVDADCDGASDYDQDRDGWDAEDFGGGDCDDVDPSAWPGAPEKPWDGVDQDCDGADLRDADGDGHDAEQVGGDDCDDEDASVHLGAFDEPGDDIDQDCDGHDTRPPQGCCCGAPGGAATGILPTLWIPGISIVRRRRVRQPKGPGTVIP